MVSCCVFAASMTWCRGAWERPSALWPVGGQESGFEEAWVESNFDELQRQVSDWSEMLIWSAFQAPSSLASTQLHAFYAASTAP